MRCRRCGKEMEYVERNGEAFYVCHDCRVKRRVDPEESSVAAKPEKRKMSKCLLIAFIIGLAYCIYSFAYWSGAVDSMGTAAEQIGAGIATALVTPHLICTVLAVIFNGLGCFLKSRGFALAGAILYAVAMVLFLAYFMFVIVEMILSFIGFAKMKKK